MDKPQKKRPKIESISDHPAENLASLWYLFGSLVLPTPASCHDWIFRERWHVARYRVQSLQRAWF
jgi:hypothetical protein